MLQQRNVETFRFGLFGISVTQNVSLNIFSGNCWLTEGDSNSSVGVCPVISLRYLVI